MKRFSYFALVGIVLLVAFSPQPAAAAGTLYLSPNVGTYGVGSTITMQVVVGSGGQAINSAQANISYDTSKLSVTNVSRSGSVFTLWPSEPQAANGVITFSGGLPSPGYSGNGGLLITVTFKATAVGTATARVVSGKVLLNDGQGTNVLTGYGLATYTINQSTPTTGGTVTPTTPVPAAPTITSSTHTEQSQWYSKNTIALNWNRADGIVDFSYLYDDQPGSTPDTITDTDQTDLVIHDSSDGVAYFHVRARSEDGWGDTGHFKIQIDTTPPEAFVVRLEGENPTGLRTPKIHFAATDQGSGMSRYTVTIDGDEPLKVGLDQTEPYTLPIMSLGDHEVTVKAYDATGNVQSASLLVTVVNRTSKTFLGSVKINWWVIVFIIVLLVVCIQLALLILVYTKRFELFVPRQRRK